MSFCLFSQLTKPFKKWGITLLHLERPKLYGVLAILSATGLWVNTIFEGRQNKKETGQVASPESVPIHLNLSVGFFSERGQKEEREGGNDSTSYQSWKGSGHSRVCTACSRSCWAVAEGWGKSRGRRNPVPEAHSVTTSAAGQRCTSSNECKLSQKIICLDIANSDSQI